MPQKVTFTIKTDMPGGPKIQEAVLETAVNTYTPMAEEIPNDKIWKHFEVLAGDKKQICFLLLAAERYKDEHCPKETDPGLLFMFNKDEKLVLELDGPMLYSGHTASCLPDRIDYVSVQNRMSDKVMIQLLLGRQCAEVAAEAQAAPAAA